MPILFFFGGAHCGRTRVEVAGDKDFPMTGMVFLLREGPGLSVDFSMRCDPVVLRLRSGRESPIP
jgi:hypothetical protein